MAITFPVIITATDDERDTYLVEIPDINGMTEGYGLEDSYCMASDYIENTFNNKEESEMVMPSDVDDLDITKSCFYMEDKSFISSVKIEL